MLYVTTLNSMTTYTAQTTLERATGTDGGLFCPMSLPRPDGPELQRLLRMPFWDCVAQVLNLFFPLRLTGDALEQPVPELVSIRHKLTVAELWDRKTGSFQGLRGALLARLGSPLRFRGNWPHIAVEIALLFGLYGQLCRDGSLRMGEPVHLATASGEFTTPMAAWYARRMGLPLGTVVCVCNDNGLPWELLHRGEARLDGACTETALPLLDIGLPCNLERLVYETLGGEFAGRYVLAREKRRSFALNPEQQSQLRAGFSVSVVGAGRANILIPRIYRTSAYLLSPYTALVYSGLMDFRALEGEGTPVLLLAEESPLRWGEAVLEALRIPAENLVEQIGRLQTDAAARRRGD